MSNTSQSTTQVSPLRGVLVGVDGSVHGHVAIDLAVQLAKQHGSRLVGIDIVDEDATQFGDYGVIDEKAEAERKEEIQRMIQRAKQSLDVFEQRCGEAGVNGIRCRKAGDAAQQIVIEAQRCDLIVLGRETHFYSEWRPDTIVGNVLRHASRPVVTVPLSLPRQQNVLVAFDGSRAAGNALFAFVASGLGISQKVHVVNVGSDAELAESVAKPAVDFLDLHGYDCALHAVVSAGKADKILLDHAAKLDAGMIVAGACGHGRLREFILGSVTKTLIQESQVPVFLFH
ncbi:Universal stress protein family protein [Rubripirellula lacrimiformis]|uniref:Universal stress protein family protein n=1 Tax=Rubripirellula lacrimiformis TaxID=1930273 RepID=A0A517N4U6_9BACT|nr:universal stress protein [Rubripirellula lacrimiformis]QDT02156.1 Universal stress protein family protein [Rubripirellula lacrimiformis]